MKRIFSEQNKFKCWLDVELAAINGWESLGRIPKGTYSRIKKKAKFTLRGIQEVEKVTNHDVVAFTTEVAKHVGEDSKWIHLGLTSNDIVDTAQALILKEASDAVIGEVESLIKVLKDLALKHKDTIMMGRTHGVHAEPTTFGIKIAVWYDEMQRNLARLKDARDGVAVGKMSGAVGNFAHCPPALEETVMRELGIKPAPASSQVVQRDRHATLMFSLAVLGGTLEKIAVTLRGLQRSEIAEVLEPFARGQKGSSAMPHKRNPITLERITGLSRLLRGNALAACENQALWDERDISHSSVERVILADSLTTADYILDKMIFILRNLDVNTRRMEENIRATKGLHFSQTVLLKLIEKGLMREKAYEIIQRNAMKTHTDDSPFYDNLLKDSDLIGVLDRNELAECFSNRHFTRYADYILARVGIIEGFKDGKITPHGESRRPKQEAKPSAPRPAPAAARRNEKVPYKPVDRSLPKREDAKRPVAGVRDEEAADLSEPNRERPPEPRRTTRRKPARTRTSPGTSTKHQRQPVDKHRSGNEPSKRPPAEKPAEGNNRESQQFDDWRKSTGRRSAVDANFKGMPNLRPKRKR